MSELVREIVEVNAAIDGDEVNPLLIVEVEGLAPTLGWTNVRLDPHVYITPPDDGVQDFDLVGDRPAPGPSGAADRLKLGRAIVYTPVTTTQLLCRLLLEKTN